MLNRTTSRVIVCSRRALVTARFTVDSRSSSVIADQWSTVVWRNPSTPAAGVRSSWETIDMNSACDRASSPSRR